MIEEELKGITFLDVLWMSILKGITLGGCV
jgi:hypothetical protein